MQRDVSLNTVNVPLATKAPKLKLEMPTND